MKINIIIIILLLCFATRLTRAQNPVPAQQQQQRILLLNGILHTGNGQTITNSAIGFENGKLKLVADATRIRIDRTAYDTIIDINGKHVYPGLIAMNTVLGLNEIEAVRATIDHTETGALNPSVRSLIAYNTDSKVIPTVRSNGVLLAQVVPGGGIVSGQSSVVELDAWNYEDAAYKSDVGVHINWPILRTTRSRDPEAEEKQKKKSAESLAQLQTLFEDARTYAAKSDHPEKNIHLESMRGLFNGSKKLFVHCNYVKDIISAAGICKQYGMQMVLVGGSDALLVSSLLKDQKIPVVVNQTHRLPSREDEDYDLPYKFPALLKEQGIEFAISVPGFWQVRNLAFHAGSAAGHGLKYEDAVQAVTLSPARILGMDAFTGSVESGKDATLIITSGDILDMKSATVEQAYIRGKLINLDNVQKQLNRKFREKYQLPAD